MVAVTLDHVSAGCNRVVNALHWGECGLVAYGAHNAVIVYDLEAMAVVSILLGHEDCVNCVHWVSGSEHDVLLSGSGDNTIRVWTRQTEGDSGSRWDLLTCLQGHTAPVTSLTSYTDAISGDVLLLSTSGDGSIRVWRNFLERDLEQSWDTIHLPLHQLPLCTAITPLFSSEWLLLAIGGVSGGVQLWVAPRGGSFVHACDLSGHQNWIRSLAFTQADTHRLLLASASEDRNIRIWAVSKGESMSEGLSKYAPRPSFKAGNNVYSAWLESLLIGHEDWVHSVHWQPGTMDDAGLCLLSASMDRTMTLWRPESTTGLWMAVESLGDAGANHLGYYTAMFSPKGDALVAHGYTGALHYWHRSSHDGGWLPKPAPGGHVAPIVDACWSANSTCLLTVSIDQTARMITQFKEGGTWCEIARPQIHGHDFNGVAALYGGGNASNHSDSHFRFASVSEEKVIRVFQAPRAFEDTLALAQGKTPPPPSSTLDGCGNDVLGASVPALGLSNRAVYVGNNTSIEEERNKAKANSSFEYGEGPDFAPFSAPAVVAGPPLEEHLAQSTLWPEIHKLYGHGNEVYCLAADPRGQWLASASRAQSASTAGIRLWDLATWTPAKGPPLEGHVLTVTHLEFSPDGCWLASCSRDRSLSLFKRVESDDDDDDRPCMPVQKVSKAHARIIWGLSWSKNSKLLATGSRDGSVKVWTLQDDQLECIRSLPIGNSVHSVAFASDTLLAVGLENGNIKLLEILEDGAIELWGTDHTNKHAAAVQKLCWRHPASSKYQLASCGDDNAVRVFTIFI